MIINRSSETCEFKDEELPIKEIIEINGEVEISRDGDYLIIKSI